MKQQTLDGLQEFLAEGGRHYFLTPVEAADVLALVAEVEKLRRWHANLQNENESLFSELVAEVEELRRWHANLQNENESLLSELIASILWQTLPIT